MGLRVRVKRFTIGMGLYVRLCVVSLRILLAAMSRLMRSVNVWVGMSGRRVGVPSTVTSSIFLMSLEMMAMMPVNA